MSPKQIWYFPHCNLHVMTRWIDSQKRWHCFRVYFDCFNNSWIQDGPKTIKEQFISEHGTFMEQIT